MDTTIRNLDEKAYRALKAQAATAGKTVGEAVNEAIRAYLASHANRPRYGSLRDLAPEAYPAGNETLSDNIDQILYGGNPGKEKRSKRR